MFRLPGLVLRAHTAQLYVAGLLAVLLVGFFAVLTRLVPEGYPGWGLLRVSLAGCVITQTLVAVGACFALADVHAAAGGAAAGLVAFGWRGLWLTFLASAVPTILFTGNRQDQDLRAAERTPGCSTTPMTTCGRGSEGW
jgi:hypothetical protein